MATTAADLLIDRLADWGVDTIFGYPGDGINGIYEALRTRQDTMRVIQVRHEEAAAFAACGYAKFTGRLGVCLATSGPGGIHLLNGLYDAKCDGIPVLAITGHTFHDLIGTHYQQDVDLEKLFMDVAVYTERVAGPAHVCNALDEAIRTALARRGVAHVNFPKDLQSLEAGNGRTKANVKHHSGDRPAAPAVLPPEENLLAAAGLINQGKKVAILAGRGALDARDLVLELASASAGRSSSRCWARAWCRTTARTRPAAWACSAPPRRRTPCAAATRSSFSAAASRTWSSTPSRAGEVRAGGRGPGPHRPALPGGGRPDRRLPRRPRSPLAPDRAQARPRLPRSGPEGDEGVERTASQASDADDTPLKPQVVAHQLNKFFDRRCDHRRRLRHGHDLGGPVHHLARPDAVSASGLLATMGNGVPYSVGRRSPTRAAGGVLTGDGGLTMVLGELATLAKYNLPVKVVVIKNNSLGQIKWSRWCSRATRSTAWTCTRSTSPAWPGRAGWPGSRWTTRPASRPCWARRSATRGRRWWRRWWTRTSRPCRGT